MKYFDLSNTKEDMQNYKRKLNNDLILIKQDLSFDDPIIKSLLDKETYKRYLERKKLEEGDDENE